MSEKNKDIELISQILLSLTKVADLLAQHDSHQKKESECEECECDIKHQKVGNDFKEMCKWIGVSSEKSSIIDFYHAMKENHPDVYLLFDNTSSFTHPKEQVVFLIFQCTQTWMESKQKK